MVGSQRRCLFFWSPKMNPPGCTRVCFHLIISSSHREHLPIEEVQPKKKKSYNACTQFGRGREMIENVAVSVECCMCLRTPPF